MNLRQVGIRVIDLDRAVDFYRRLLDREPLAVFNPPGFAFFDLDGVRLFLDVNPPDSAVYLGVDDVRTAVEKLRDAGVRIVNEPHIVFPDPTGVFDTPGNEWLAFIEDSESNLVGLMSREVS